MVFFFFTMVFVVLQVKWDEAFKNMMCMKILIRLIKIVLATYLHSSNNVLLLYLVGLGMINLLLLPL